MEPSDTSDVDTALRELEEETGIVRSDVRILGTHHDVNTRVTSIVVTPVIGYIVRDLRSINLRTSPNEVDFCFSVPLAQLCDKSNQELYRNMPSFPSKTDPNLRIWGATAYILKHFLDQIYIPAKNALTK